MKILLTKQDIKNCIEESSTTNNQKTIDSREISDELLDRIEQDMTYAAIVWNRQAMMDMLDAILDGYSDIQALIVPCNGEKS